MDNNLQMESTLGICTEEIQRDGKDTYDSHRYEPTPYDVLETLFDAYPLTKKDVLIDYGCGLGRLNFYATHRFSCKTIGVEKSNAYYRRALMNCQTFTGDINRVVFVHDSADAYLIPPDVNYFYFFNPFSTAVLRRVIQQIIVSYRSCARTMTLILYYPEDAAISYLTHHTDFVCIDEIAACDLIKNDRRERFSIFRMV